MGKRVISLSILIIIVICAAPALSGCADSVNLSYDQSPENLVIEYWTGGGLAPRWEDQVADFTLYGDGRVVKDLRGSETGLMVEGNLGKAGVGELLGEIEAAGFFNLKDEYFNRDIMDAAGSTVTVSLEDQEKTVFVYAMDVEAFDNVVDILMNFPLDDEKEYVPETAFLYVDSVDPSEVADDSYGEVYGMLPSLDELEQSGESGEPVEIDGETFASLKKLESETPRYGIGIIVDGAAFRLFPVYIPSDRL